MSEEKANNVEGKPAVDFRTQLSVEGNLLSIERTQLSWVRTTLGLITAGIAIDKGTAALHEARMVSGEAWINNSHAAGLILTATGTMLLLLVTVIYGRRIARLNHMLGIHHTLPSTGTIVSMIICLFGIISFYILSIDG